MGPVLGLIYLISLRDTYEREWNPEVETRRGKRRVKVRKGVLCVCVWWFVKKPFLSAPACARWDWPKLATCLWFYLWSQTEKRRKEGSATQLGRYPLLPPKCKRPVSLSLPLPLPYLSHTHIIPLIYIHLFILLFIIILFYLYLYCFNSTPTCLFNCFLLFSMLNKLGVLRLGILLLLILLLIDHNCWTAPGISRSIIESNKIIRKLTTLI